MCFDYFQENSLSLKSVLEISSYDGVTLDYFRNFFKKNFLRNFLSNDSRN